MVRTSETSIAVLGITPAGRAYSMSWPILWSIWARSPSIAVRASSLTLLSSISSRMRASGVRRSWEMPASISSLSASIWRKSRAMRLKAWLRSRISSGPSLVGKGAGFSPRATCCTALDRRERGMLTNRTLMAAPVTASIRAIMPQPSHSLIRETSEWLFFNSSQYNSSLTVKLIQIPVSPFMLATTRVSGFLVSSLICWMKVSQNRVLGRASVVSSSWRGKNWISLSVARSITSALRSGEGT